MLCRHRHNVHLIRASLRWVSYKDRKVVAGLLRPIYTAPTEQAALEALDTLADSDFGRENPAVIRRLHRSEGVPIKVIARVMGISKNTVKAALRSDGPPHYERPLRGSLVDAVEPRIRELLAAVPTMPATVIAERIGWQHSIRILRDRVAELRPMYLPPDPASRTSYAAGEIAQCDQPDRSTLPAHRPRRRCLRRTRLRTRQLTNATRGEPDARERARPVRRAAAGKPAAAMLPRRPAADPTHPVRT